MKTIFEISLSQARDAELVILGNTMLRTELVQTASNEWEYAQDLDMEFEEDREQYEDFVEEVKLVLDLAHIDYETSDVLEPNGVVICLEELK